MGPAITMEGLPPSVHTFWITSFNKVSLKERRLVVVASVRAASGIEVYEGSLPPVPSLVLVFKKANKAPVLRAAEVLPAAAAWLASMVVSMSRFNSALRLANW